MSAFDRLIAAADEDTLALVRRMIGKETLALYIAKTIASSIGAKIDADAVADIFGIEKESAYNKISKIDPIK
jgi:hypothetical protein